MNEVAGVDIDVLTAWMDEQGLGAGTGPLQDIVHLGGGTQNILLRFERDGRRYVLRRPPPHKRANSDDTMRREARVLTALAGSDVPHPGVIASCPDETVIGAAFYLMEPIDGFNPSVGLPSPHRDSPEIRHQMGLAMSDAIAALGRVDYLAVGLEGFGRPEGFLERQVPRWKSHLDSYAAIPGYPGPDIPGVEKVGEWLDRNRPTEFQPGIIPGDFHLANVMFAPDGPRLAAMVDWELSTIGDPLLDLGWLLCSWPETDGGDGGTASVFPWDGFPTAAELVERYRQGSSREVDAWPWYEVLACYKLGIILEGTHARALAGKAPKVVGDMLHASTLGLFARATARIASA